MALIGPKSAVMAKQAAERTLVAIGQFTTLRSTPVSTSLGTTYVMEPYLTNLNGRIGTNVGQVYGEPLKVDNVKLWRVTLPPNLDILVTDLVQWTPPGGATQTLTIKQILSPQSGMNASTVLLCSSEGT